MCNTIQKINLESNLISDKDNLYYLSEISSLIEININDNPLKVDFDELKSIFPNVTNYNYKVAVYIDDDDIDSSTSTLSRSGNFLSSRFSRPVSSRPSSALPGDEKDGEKLTSRKTIIQGSSDLLSLRRYKDDFSISTATERSSATIQRNILKKHKDELHHSPQKNIKDLKLVRKKFEFIELKDKPIDLKERSIELKDKASNKEPKSLLNNIKITSRKDVPIKLSKYNNNTVRINIDAGINSEL